MLLRIGTFIIAIGIILLVTGIIYGIKWSASLQTSLMEENTILPNTIINASTSVNVSAYISNTIPLLTLVIDRDDSDGVLEEKITDPHRSILSNRNFSQDFIYSLKPKIKGMYIATISNNILKRPVTTSISFGHFHVPSIAHSESISQLVQDTILIILGFIFIILGLVLRLTFMVKKPPNEHANNQR